MNRELLLYLLSETEKFMRTSNTQQYFSARQPGQKLSQDSWTADRKKQKPDPNNRTTKWEDSRRAAAETFGKLFMHFQLLVLG